MITPERLAASGSESGHQKALFCWAKQNEHLYSQLKWLFAVPNGFYSDSGQKAKMKAEGLRDGVPDVILPWPIWDHNAEFNNQVKCCGCFIELKTEKRRKEKNGGCSEDQVEWIAQLRELGYSCFVCYSWEEARDRLLEYLKQ